MADKNDAAGPTGKSGKGKWIVIAALAAVGILAGGGTGAWFLLGQQAEPSAAQAAAPKAPPRQIPLFVDLDTFTVNLRDGDGERMMQLKLVAEVRDSATGEMIKTLMPAVRNEILLLLGSRDASQIATREGKEQLARDIVASANKVLDGTASANGVEGVNFTHLIVQ